MIDPRATELEAAKDVEPIYHAELAKTRHIGPLLEGAAAVEAPWACSASAYSAASFGGVAFLLVGDAGSFIDPLSSFGIKKALASAWLAAVVVHTCLETPHMTGPPWRSSIGGRRTCTRHILARAIEEREGGRGRLLASLKAIDDAAPFYGVLPGGLPDTSTVQCPIQGHFADAKNDAATEALPGLEESLKSAGVESEFFIYEGTHHAFCNDDRPDVYNEQACRKALERSVQFFQRHLVAG